MSTIGFVKIFISLQYNALLYQLALLLRRVAQIPKESIQPAPLGSIEAIIKIPRKVFPKIEDSVWVLVYYLIDMVKTNSHGGIELFYKCRVQGFIADPGGKYKGQPRQLLPSFPKVINERR